MKMAATRIVWFYLGLMFLGGGCGMSMMGLLFVRAAIKP